MLRLIQCCLEFCDKAKTATVGEKRRGIYVLYNNSYEVLYIGMTDSSIRKRLASHRRSKNWTYFSAYAVWPNITKEEIKELEGLFRHIYRRDKKANSFNVQRGYKELRKITTEDSLYWQQLTEFGSNRKVSTTRLLPNLT